MPNYHQPLLPSNTYHLFTRAIGNEKLFIEEKNYSYFLQKLAFHTFEIADVLTYSLLPNHIHLLVRIKSFESIALNFEKVKKRPVDPLLTNISDFIMERFSNLLNSYTKSINKMYKRKGSLFIDYMKRSKVEDNWDLTAFIYYTHKNAVHHGYASCIGEWKYDGYQSLISEKQTKLLREELFGWFGGKEQFMGYHQQPVKIKEVMFCEV